VAEQSPAGAQPSSTKPSREGIPWRLIVLGAIGLYGLLLVILNAKQVNVNFVFFSTRASLVVVLIVALGVGFLGGFLFDTVRERRKRGAKA
jgi:uncharacterized integral membrane protein